MISWLFKRKRPPLPGELWEFKKGDGSPWPSKDYEPVKILDVRDGWVRYSMDGFFRDERMTVSSFMYCYRKVL